MRVAAPLVLTETAPARAAALAEIVGAGWPIVGAAPQPGQVWDLHVSDRSAATGAVLAAARGCGLLVLAGREAAADLADDLRGVGHLYYRGEAALALDAASWAMLQAVAGGHTVEAAAHRLHLSVRTAQRRLATAQDALGAPSLAAAVAQLGAADRISPAPR